MERRRALIIANSDYDKDCFSVLASPVRDAKELARVLRDPLIGCFEVQTILNESASSVNEKLEDFFVFSDPKPDDLLLLYFSGHGVVDDAGVLYLCTRDTELIRQNIRRTSAVGSHFVDEQMRRSRSRRQILILDCCYSGAFSTTQRAKSEVLPSLDSFFHASQGKGRVVLTSSGATQPSFESRLGGSTAAAPSVYTQMLINGLETGAADRYGDGKVDLDELHEYLLQQLRDSASHQMPTKSGYVEGQLYIALNKVFRPTETLEDVRERLRAEAKKLEEERAEHVSKVRQFAEEQAERQRKLDEEAKKGFWDKLFGGGASDGSDGGFWSD